MRVALIPYATINDPPTVVLPIKDGVFGRVWHGILIDKSVLGAREPLGLA